MRHLSGVLPPEYTSSFFVCAIVVWSGGYCNHLPDARVVGLSGTECRRKHKLFPRHRVQTTPPPATRSTWWDTHHGEFTLARSFSSVQVAGRSRIPVFFEAIFFLAGSMYLLQLLLPKVRMRRTRYVGRKGPGQVWGVTTESERGRRQEVTLSLRQPANSFHPAFVLGGAMGRQSFSGPDTTG